MGRRRTPGSTLVAATLLAIAPARAQHTTRVSVPFDGSRYTGCGEHPALSASGRFITFESWSNRLVPGDTT